MRGHIEKYEVQQPTYVETFSAGGAAMRFATSTPSIRLVVVIDPTFTDGDDMHFLESVQAGVREVTLDVCGSPIIRPAKNPLPALAGDAPQTAGDTW